MNRLTLAAPLCALVVVAGLPLVARGQGMAVTGERPLDLSVPSQSLSGAWGASAGGVAPQLPNLGGSPGPAPSSPGLKQSGGFDRALPYGAGYEARHAQSGGGVGRGWGRGP